MIHLEVLLQLPIAAFIAYQVWRISHSLKAFEIRMENHDRRITKLEENVDNSA